MTSLIRHINIFLSKKCIKTDPGVINARKIVEFFPGDHESCQIGSVNGQKHNSKHCPHICHKSVGKKSN